jgi:hypothetical protein
MSGGTSCRRFDMPNRFVRLRRASSYKRPHPLRTPSSGRSVTNRMLLINICVISLICFMHYFVGFMSVIRTLASITSGLTVGYLRIIPKRHLYLKMILWYSTYSALCTRIKFEFLNVVLGVAVLFCVGHKSGRQVLRRFLVTATTSHRVVGECAEICRMATTHTPCEPING